MPSIRVLPPEIRDRLRAGEVIERPVSALKELLENSIDAGATRIRVDISGGGKRLLRVWDDGCGMAPEDAILSLERHATSKISDSEELDCIRTLGFRGEALPSIALVSRFRLDTALRGSSEGVSIEAEGGQVISNRPSAASGTAIEVNDLFFNTPARKNFLKSDAAENARMLDMITKYALAHPAIGFTAFADGKENMAFPPAADERERLSQIYGAEFLDGLHDLQAKTKGISLRLFLSKEGNWRASRSGQFLFINGRPVKDNSLTYAVYAAHTGLMAGKHPVFFIFLSVDPALIDVNVHPRKEEIRFRDKDAAYRFLMRSARDALASGASSTVIGRAREAVWISSSPGSGTADRLPGTSGIQTTGNAGADYLKASEAPAALPLMSGQKMQRGYIHLGGAFSAWSEGDGVTIIDRHACHERVLYERLLKSGPNAPGNLLFPLRIGLAPREYAVVTANLPLLNELDIEAEDFGAGSVLLRAVPASLAGSPLSASEWGGILSDLAHEIDERGSAEPAIKKAVAARLACHSSVRGAEELSSAELDKLLESLFSCEDPYHCPHGRPTLIKLGKEDLEKMFRRK
ncbi:MAG: DNA mismatch repair endonuclease MutL [Nitrospiraceae bacterium]|nr:DNA mismatch repair endonuclease MutL [Nitrospiraceae bacterium]